MKPPFGTLNATLAKTILAKAPKYRRIVEPFGDGGTLALELAKKRPKEHVVNVVDEALFLALDFVQRATSADLSRLKKFDWIGSPETFEAVSAITADSGPEMFYRWFYLKKFGMRMSADPEAPPTFDLLSTGLDLKMKLIGLPLMRVGLKGVTLLNEDPLAVLSRYGAGSFLILLPKTPEHVEAVRGRLSGQGGDFFFAAKVADADVLVEDARKYSALKVAGKKVASIMMSTMSVIANYDTGLPAIDPAGMVMEDAA